MMLRCALRASRSPAWRWRGAARSLSSASAAFSSAQRELQCSGRTRLDVFERSTIHTKFSAANSFEGRRWKATAVAAEEDEVVPIPFTEGADRAHVTPLSYAAMRASADLDHTKFWEEKAKEELEWMHPFDEVLAGALEDGNVRWFGGGELNVCVNCVDRHVRTQPNKVCMVPFDAYNEGDSAHSFLQRAIIWEGDEGEEQIITYSKLLDKVCRLSNVLKRFGVKKGDRVAIYMPMVPEAAIAMLACARIGAIHSVVFAGFSSDAIRQRLHDAEAKVVITADVGYRGGKELPLKEAVDEAVENTKVQSVIVHQRGHGNVPMKEGRDHWMKEEMKKERPYCPPARMSSEDALFVLYTSGSTGTPKGVLHTSAGYLLYTSVTHKYIFDIQPEDVYACVADVGWITGHSYVVYGPLSNGTTTVMFESIPTYPTAARYWDMIEKLGVTKFYTAPTAIRALMKHGDEPTKKHDISTLKVLGTVGEPINPEAWKWYFSNVGRNRCSIVDTYWQTETGGVVCSVLPHAMDMKPGSAAKPFPGISFEVMDPDTRAPTGMARNVWGNHERYLDAYFRDFPGYYFTGDGARVDKDGYVWITGRVDDVINKAGHRLGTAEIESALVTHDACAEAAVVSVPDDVKGEAIVAYCSLREGCSYSEGLEADLKKAVRGAIGAIAQPDYVLVTSNLPKTRSGKIMRRVLRKLAAGDMSTLADPSSVEELVREWDKMRSK